MARPGAGDQTPQKLANDGARAVPATQGCDAGKAVQDGRNQPRRPRVAHAKEGAPVGPIPIGAGGRSEPGFEPGSVWVRVHRRCARSQSGGLRLQVVGPPALARDRMLRDSDHADLPEP